MKGRSLKLNCPCENIGESCVTLIWMPISVSVILARAKALTEAVLRDRGKPSVTVLQNVWKRINKRNYANKRNITQSSHQYFTVLQIMFNNMQRVQDWVRRAEKYGPLDNVNMAYVWFS